MRLRLSLSLLAFVMASLSQAATTVPAATSDLGNVMFVGDSITHGVNGASWRYSFHKILVDNGISYNAEGYKSGNYSNGVGTSTTYGGILFNNEHSAQASARAWEIAGRTSGSRFDGTNIKDWLGQSTVKTDGTTAYTGPTFTGDQTPDTFFLLIGTNDLLSDHTNSASGITGAVDQLLTDVGTIVSSMHEANKDAPVYIMTVPAWTTHANNNANDVHEAVAAYNEKLISWGQNQENVYIIDINAGLIDVSSSTSFFACTSMFNTPGTDGLHPNAQGELIIAGNLAKAMGYAGRSVGLERKSNSNLTTHFSNTSTAFTKTNVTVSSNTISFSNEGDSTLSYTWASKPTGGYTVDFNATVGNGSTGGWDTTTNLSVALGNGTQYGILNLNEAYIQWGDTVLYSTDMSKLSDSLRIAYVIGNSGLGISTGYYVWLDDQLIGEALSATTGTTYNGVTFSYSGTGKVSVSNLSIDGNAAYAPTTTGYYNSADALSLEATSGKGMGTITWNEKFTATAFDQTASGTFSARDTADNTAGKEGSVIGVSISSGSCAYIYANTSTNANTGTTGNDPKYTGDVWLTISNEGNATSWYGAHGANGTLTGNAYLRFTDTATGGSTVFGAVNASAVTGNVYLEFSADGASFNSFTSAAVADGNSKYSVVGSFKTNITGKVDIVINAGEFRGNVMGGEYYDNRTIEGGTNIYVNGGSIKGDVYGGGKTGTVGKAATADTEATGTAINITGGTISGNVYGGSMGGEIAGNTSVTLYGGYLLGNVYAGGTDGSIGGDTSVTVDGSSVRVYNGSAWGTISAGGTGGTITGNTSVTLQNITSTASKYGFDKFAGTISGGGTEVTGATKSLTLSNVQANLLATLENFTEVTVTKASNTALSSLGGATALTVDKASTFTLTGGVATLTKVSLESGSTLALASKESSTLVDSEIAGALNLSAGSNVTLADTSKLNKAQVTVGSGTQLTLNKTTTDHSVTSLGGTGTLSNNGTLNIITDKDASFAGTLAGTGTIDLTGAGTQTFIGAGATGQTVNVKEGGLQLLSGTADSVALNSLTAAKGTKVALTTSSKANASSLLNLNSDLDVEGANLVLTVATDLSNYSSTPIISVADGSINMDKATVTLGQSDSSKDPETISDIKLTIAALKPVTSTGSTSNSGSTGNGSDSSSDTTTYAKALLASRGVRLVANSADDDDVSADGTTVDGLGAYGFYYTNLAVTTTDTEVLLTGTVREDNPFTSSGTTPNATAGANMVWDSLSQTTSSSELGLARAAVRVAIQDGDAAKATKLLAGIAGSTVNATGTAQRDALRSQLGWIRNRTTLMGVDSDFSYDDLPYVHMWVEGTGSSAQLDSDGDQGGYKLSSWGGTVGVDADVTEHTTLGAAFSAQFGSLSSSAAEYADGDLDSYYVSLFARFQKKAWAHTLILTAGWNDASLDRTVNYGSGSYTTQGDTSGSGFGAMYELTYDIPLNEDKSSVFQPLFNASIVKTSLDAYTETGAGNAGLEVGKQDWTTATLALGARWMGLVGTNVFGREALLEVRANIAQDLGDDQGETTVALSGNPKFTQTVYGAQVGKTAAQLGVGLTIPVGQQGNVFVNGNAEVRSGAHSINGSLGYRYSF